MSVDVQGDLSQNLTSVNLSDLNPSPDYIQSRLLLWEKFKARYDTELLQKQNQSVEIVVKAKNKDGDLRELKVNNWKTSPADIAKQIGPKSWHDSLVISKVNDVLWDLERPLETNCFIEFLNFDEDEGNPFVY